MSEKDFYWRDLPFTGLGGEIVKELLDDLTDRKGLRHEWESIDDDIKKEIIERWIELTNRKISLATGRG